MSLRWHPWTGPSGQLGLATSLPYELTDGICVEPTLRLYVDEHGGDGSTGGVILDIRVSMGGLWTSATSCHKSVDEALQRLDTTWRTEVARAKCACAAWEACP